MQYEILKSFPKFEVVNENELQKVIDKVRRQRMKCKEKEIWSEFCCKELNKLKIQNADEISMNEVKRALPHFYEGNEKFQCTSSNDSHENTRELLVLKPSSSNESTREEDLKHYKQKMKEKSKKLTYSNLTAVSVPVSYPDATENLKLLFFIEKIDFSCSKILNILGVIELGLNDFHVPETPKETLQYQKKALEFCIRFSRNHFYQIETQLKRYISVVSIKEQSLVEKIGELGYQAISKLSQALLTGYYTFYRHMHVVWGYNGVAEKLNDLLEITRIFVHTIRKYQEIKNITSLNKIEIIIDRMTGFISHLVNTNYPELHFKHDKKKLQNVERLQSAKTVAKTGKRRVKSANSVDPYYMYKSKQDMKNGYNCKMCCTDKKKNDKSSIDVFRRLTLPKKYMLNQHLHSFKNTNDLHDVNCIKKSQIIPDSVNADVIKKIKTNAIPSDTVVVDNLIPLIADHFREIYDIPQKEKKPHKISKQYNISIGNGNEEYNLNRKVLNNENVKTISFSYDCNDDSLMKTVVKKTSDENGKNVCLHCAKNIRHCHDFGKRRSYSDSDLPKFEKNNESVDRIEYKQNHVNEISNDLMTNELSSVTTEIDAPLKHFINKEVMDFSNFLYKTCSIENQKLKKKSK